ncbi:MAG TPA: hypothetical protein VIF09_01300, partial [Polyangiaceae bacterium]
AARDAVSIPPDTARAAPVPSAPSVPPDTARGLHREEMPTFTDEVELEAARLKSKFTVPPPSAGTVPPPAPVELAPPSEPLTPEALEADYERRFGGFDKVPVMVAPRDQVAALAMDGRASMLLALLDGRSSVQALLDIGILNRVDTLSGIAELVERGVILLLG